MPGQATFGLAEKVASAGATSSCSATTPPVSCAPSPALVTRIATRQADAGRSRSYRRKRACPRPLLRYAAVQAAALQFGEPPLD
jgi:hypothetical protein